LVARGQNRAHLGAGIVLSAALVCAAAIALVSSPAAPAADLQSQIDAKQRQVDAAKQKEGVLTTDISRLSDRIGTLEGQVATLRNREARVKSELAAKQAELDRAVAELRKAKHYLKVVRARLRRAIHVLEQRLVAIYKSDQPDTIDVILQAKGYQDLLERSTYLDRIQEFDSSIVHRVRDLREKARNAVQRLRAIKQRVKEARDAIAAKERELAQTRSALESQQGQLVTARGDKRDALSSISDHRQELEGQLSDLDAQLQQQLAASSGPALAAGPIKSGSAGFIWPVNGPVVSGFGWRFGGGEFHRGIDIAVGTGTPIRAAKGGVVVQAGPYDGYGNFTCINHGGGLSTCYAHQESIAVSTGQSVSQGQVIGYSDCTGYCFGPHVHFEVRVNGTAVDPMGCL
jgi:peptidoglycan DL-endopeptidase CwlO